MLPYLVTLYLFVHVVWVVGVFLVKNLHELRLCLITCSIHCDQRSDGPHQFETGVEKGFRTQPSMLMENLR